MSRSGPLGLGVIGAGRFADFVASAVSSSGDARIVTVTDTSHERAAAFAATHDASVSAGVSDLLRDERVECVLVASPPNTHADLSCAALSAGRHVFCEKPTALDEAAAERVQAAVDTSGRAYVVDHVLRYNPILALLSRLRAQGLLGPVRRLAFENDASDEDLAADHWFWDQDVSGGILLEHGVHFFDAASWLIDAPVTEVQALAHTRPNGATDTVVCTARHANGALATYAHGFTHARRAERQLMRVDFGAAEARVHGWIPVRCELDVWATEAEADCYAALPAQATQLLDVRGGARSTAARIEVEVDRDAAAGTSAPHHVTAVVDLGGPAAKEQVYRAGVRAAFADLVAATRSGTRPHAGIDAGRAAVSVAAAATRALAEGRTCSVIARESA